MPPDFDPEQVGNVAGIIKYLLSTDLVRYAIYAVLAWTAWDYRVPILNFLKVKVPELWKKFTDGHAPVAPTSDRATEAPLASLQELTAWVVNNGSPKQLAKFTALFAEIQAMKKGSDK